MKTLLVSHPSLFITTYLVVITALLFIAARLFRRKWTKPGPGRSLALKLSVSAFAVLYLFVALETVFAYFVNQSDAFGFTLASERWFHKHWQPINAAGYRDYDPVRKEHLAYVVGDSFVTGAGIEKVRDRFANLLADDLGESWCVALLARNGWNTDEYAKALANQEAKPDLIIISYFVNDILSAASSIGFEIPEPKKDINPLIRPIVDYSYLFNWAYWKVFRSKLDTTLWWGRLKQAYNNEAVWKTHTLELDALIEIANRENVKIAFIIWPNLADVAGSEDITSRVIHYLNGKSVTALDLTLRFKNRSLKSLVVNSTDPHPNRAVHAEVAQLLHEILRTRE